MIVCLSTTTVFSEVLSKLQISSGWFINTKNVIKQSIKKHLQSDFWIHPTVIKSTRFNQNCMHSISVIRTMLLLRHTNHISNNKLWVCECVQLNLWDVWHTLGYCGTAPWLATWHISGTVCSGLVRWRGSLPVGAHRIIEVVPSCKLLLHLFSGTEKVFTRGVPYATQMPIVLQLNTPHRFWRHPVLSCTVKLGELFRRRRCPLF